MIELIEQLEQKLSLDKLVEDFYEKVLADERINIFFKGVNLDKQLKKMKNFLTVALGGSTAYNKESNLQIIHKILVSKGLTDKHFSAFLENMALTLNEHEVPKSLIHEILALAESYRDLVMGRRL